MYEMRQCVQFAINKNSVGMSSINKRIKIFQLNKVTWQCFTERVSRICLLNDLLVARGYNFHFTVTLIFENDSIDLSKKWQVYVDVWKKYQCNEIYSENILRLSISIFNDTWFTFSYLRMKEEKKFTLKFISVFFGISDQVDVNFDFFCKKNYSKWSKSYHFKWI